MNQHDHLVPLDDLLLARWSCCTCCGCRKPLVWANVVALAGLPGLAVLLCHTCHTDPDTPDILGPLLIARVHGKQGE